MMRLAGACLGLAAVGLLLAGCGSAPRPAPTQYTTSDGTQTTRSGIYKVGKPYQIQGVWYYPSEDYSYDETGIASWYGPDFHGKYTANGEVFDQDEVSAAHRTLPMPCIVRVTNLENGRSILVRVNDRGPFAHSRILDLSKHAAELLAMDLQGTARVRVQIVADDSRALALQFKNGDQTPLDAAPRVAVQSETLPPPSNGRSAPPPKSSSAKPVAKPVAVAEVTPPPDQRLETQTVQQVAPRSTQLFIQAGAFSRFDNANRLSASLSAVGTPVISQVQTKVGALFRVRLGPLPSVTEADAMLEKVIASGFPDARLVVD